MAIPSQNMPCAGQELLPSCTLPYAPPEVVLAVFEQKTVIVQPSHDIWSMGVLGYEALTHSQAIQYQNEVRLTGLQRLSSI